MKKLINSIFNLSNLPILILISALTISITGSFFSIYGLGKLFGGHQIGATILAFAFEFGNIVTAASLKFYWRHLPQILKYPLIIIVITLTILTSMGIYGYLADGFEKTRLKDEVITKRSNLVNIKKESFNQRLNDNKKELESINLSLQELSKGYNQNTQSQQVIKGQVVTNVIVGNKKGLEQQMNSLNLRKNKLDSLNLTYLDSIQYLELQIIEIENSNETNSELGPLKYLANLTGYPMVNIVNWLILLIVIVFQPLALLLIITSMFAFKNNHYLTRTGNRVKTNKNVPTSNDPPNPVVEHVEEEKVKPKRNYTRKKRNESTINELPQSDETQTEVQVQENDSQETKITNTENPKPRKGKRRIVDTNLTPDIADHIAASLRRNKLSPSQIKISPHQATDKNE